MNPKPPLIPLFLSAVLFLGGPASGFERPAFEPSPAKCQIPLAMLPSDDSPPPPADDRGFDVLSYDLDINLDPVSRTVTGTVDIGVRALDPGRTRLRLDLVDNMIIGGVTFRGADALYTHQGDSLEVVFSEALATTSTETLTVRWHGRPLPHGNFNTGLMFRTNENGTPGFPDDDLPIIANQNQPWSAHSWWPCKDHPSDKALVSLTVTVPDHLKAISNGTLMFEDAPAPGLRRASWREAYPIATYLVSVAATNYDSWSEDCLPGDAPPVRLDFHVFPHDRAKAEYDLARTCDMMDFMVDLAGPYPFPGEKYAQVEYKWAGSMEHQTATSLSPIVFTGDRFFELVVIHELAHQWFGDSLTPAVWADIWLNEGFARYIEALWLERTEGRQAYNDFLRLIGPQRHPDLFVNAGVLGDPDPILPNTLVYDKGAWVLHMLRMWIGDTVFREFLHSYATAPELALGSVTASDMIRFAEAASGRDLSGFFGPWLTTSQVPVISSETRRLHPGQGNQGVVVTLNQLQTPLFQVAVPLVVHTECRSIPGIMMMDGASHSLTLETSCRVDSVSIDPEGLVLMRQGSAPPPVLQVVGPWPNPITAAGAEFRIYLMMDREVIARIYDARGRLVEESPLGNLAATGPMDDPASEPHLWTWPDAAGAARIPAGVYWAEFEASGVRAVRKLTFLH